MLIIIASICREIMYLFAQVQLIEIQYIINDNNFHFNSSISTDDEWCSYIKERKMENIQKQKK